MVSMLTAQKEAITSALKEFFKKDKNIDMKTDLDADEILLLNNLEFSNKWILENWKVDQGLNIYSDDYKAKRVSHKRGGRMEMQTVLSNQKVEEPTQKDLVNKLLGAT